MIKSPLIQKPLPGPKARKLIDQDRTCVRRHRCLRHGALSSPGGQGCQRAGGSPVAHVRDRFLLQRPDCPCKKAFKPYSGKRREKGLFWELRRRSG